MIERPLRSLAEIEALRPFEPRQELGMVLEAIRLLRVELAGRVPLIGFAGAPFTLASYAIEGGRSSNFARTKALMYGEPSAWHRLAELSRPSSPTTCWRRSRRGRRRCSCSTRAVGALDAADYTEFVLPHVQGIFERLRGAGAPTIHFGTCTGHLLALQRRAGGDVIGADWRTPLDEAWRALGDDAAIQGNLDPTLLLGPRQRLLDRVDDVLRRAASRRGHISTSATGSCRARRSRTSRAVVEHVHERTAVRAGGLGAPA